MPRPKGLPKSGGRVRGTPNRKTFLLHEALETLELNIPERLAELIPNLSPEKQVDVYLALLPFIFPKRKALELSPDEKGSLSIAEFAAKLSKDCRGFANETNVLAS